MIQEKSEEHYTPSPSFSELLRYAAYGTGNPDPRDLHGVRAWQKELDSLSQRMWAEAYQAGRARGMSDASSYMARPIQFVVTQEELADIHARWALGDEDSKAL